MSLAGCIVFDCLAQPACLVFQVSSVRGCALLHRPVVRAVRCSRMTVRAAVSVLYIGRTLCVLSLSG